MKKSILLIFLIISVFIFSTPLIYEEGCYLNIDNTYKYYPFSYISIFNNYPNEKIKFIQNINISDLDKSYIIQNNTIYQISSLNIIDVDNTFLNPNLLLEHNLNFDKTFSNTTEFKKFLQDISSFKAFITISNEIVLDEDLTIPENITISFKNDGAFYIPKNITLKIDSKFYALDSYIFKGDGIVIGNKYIENSYPEWFGAAADGTTDDSTSINKAISFVAANKGTIYFSNKTYAVSASNPIRPFSNTKLILEDNTILKIIPNNLTSYSIIKLENVENISISGGKVLGDKQEHIMDIPLQNEGETADEYHTRIVKLLGEWGHGIDLRSASNILLENISIEQCWGDGIYIGVGIKKYNENITLNNITCNHNRRQGISIISAKTLIMESCKLLNTGSGTDNDYRQSTAPRAGIDFEPNNNGELLQNIIINNLYSENNIGGGVSTYISYKYNTGTSIDITLNNYIDKYSKKGISFGSKIGSNAIGSIIFNNATLYNSYESAVRIRNYNTNLPHIHINGLTIIDPNRKGVNSSKYNSAISIYREASDEGNTTIGNATINNISISYTDKNDPVINITKPFYKIDNYKINETEATYGFSNLHIEGYEDIK